MDLNGNKKSIVLIYNNVLETNFIVNCIVDCYHDFDVLLDYSRNSAHGSDNGLRGNNYW